MAVEVLAGSVVTNRGPWVSVAGGDLDVAQVHAGVEHGGDEGVAEHVRVWPGDRHPGSFGQMLQAAGGGMAVHPGTSGVEQDRPACPGADGPVDGAPDRWGQRDQDDLAAFAAHTQYPVAVFFAEVGDNLDQPPVTADLLRGWTSRSTTCLIADEDGAAS